MSTTGSDDDQERSLEEESEEELSSDELVESWQSMEKQLLAHESEIRKMGNEISKIKAELHEANKKKDIDAIRKATKDLRTAEKSKTEAIHNADHTRDAMWEIEWTLANNFFEDKKNVNEIKFPHRKGTNMRSFIKINDEVFMMARKEQKLGEGAFGIVKPSFVFNGKAEALDRDGEACVVKVIKISTDKKGKERKDFIEGKIASINKEAEVLDSLGQLKEMPLVRKAPPSEDKEAEVLDSLGQLKEKPKDEWAAKVYVIQKRHPGKDLFYWLNESGKPLDEKQKTIIALQCCKQLADLHDAGYLHLDVKQENFLVDINPEKPYDIKVNLIDFGYSEKLPPEKDSIALASYAGTLGYMAPEMLNVEEKVYKASRETDIFSLGMMFRNDLELKESNIYKDMLRLDHRQSIAETTKRLESYQEYLEKTSLSQFVVSDSDESLDPIDRVLNLLAEARIEVIARKVENEGYEVAGLRQFYNEIQEIHKNKLSPSQEITEIYKAFDKAKKKFFDYLPEKQKFIKDVFDKSWEVVRGEMQKLEIVAVKELDNFPIAKAAKSIIPTQEYNLIDEMMKAYQRSIKSPKELDEFNDMLETKLNFIFGEFIDEEEETKKSLAQIWRENADEEEVEELATLFNNVAGALEKMKPIKTKGPVVESPISQHKAPLPEPVSRTRASVADTELKREPVKAEPIKPKAPPSVEPSIRKEAYKTSIKERVQLRKQSTPIEPKDELSRKKRREEYFAARRQSPPIRSKEDLPQATKPQKTEEAKKEEVPKIKEPQQAEKRKATDAYKESIKARVRLRKESTPIEPKESREKFTEYRKSLAARRQLPEKSRPKEDMPRRPVGGKPKI